MDNKQITTTKFKLKKMDIDMLVKHPRHPRKDIGDIENLKLTIQTDGIHEPPLIVKMDNQKYGVIDGMRRIEAARQIGLKQIDCLQRTDVDEIAAMHIAYLANVERSSLSPLEIANHLKMLIDEFGLTYRDLSKKGYGSIGSISNYIKLLKIPEPIKEKLEDDSITTAHVIEVARLPENKQEKMVSRIIDHDLSVKRTKTLVSRQIAQLKKVEPVKVVKLPATDIPGVYFKDSCDMPEIADQSVHLILTSPPYGVGKEYETDETFQDLLDNVQAVLRECSRVLVPGGVLVLNVADINNFRGNDGKNDYRQVQLMGHHYQEFLRQFKIYLTDLITWQKPIAWGSRKYIRYDEKTMHTSYRMMDNSEMIYVYRKQGHRELPDADAVLDSYISKEEWKQYINAVWNIDSIQKVKDHPCEWPEELPKRLIRLFSFEGDTVLDPFLGSGVAVKVARELKRIGIGYEREVKYKAAIMRKLGLKVSKGLEKKSGKRAVSDKIKMVA